MNYEQIITAAGGVFRGRMAEGGMEIILFDSKQTGTTLAMFVEKITGVDAVRRHIALSDAKFKLAATSTNLQRSLEELREGSHV